LWKYNTKNLNLTNEKLSQMRSILEQQLLPLKTTLNVDLKDGDAKAKEYLKKFNSIFEKIERDTRHSEQYYLIKFYYRSDNDLISGLNKQEYERFLGRLVPEDKQWFEAQGNFEKLAGQDGILDKHEFYKLIGQLMKERSPHKVKNRFNML